MKRIDPLKWLSANGHRLAALTGQDTEALRAAASCWTLYACGDQDGMRYAIDALRALYRAMQPHTAPMIVRLIPWALDWEDERELGPLVDGTLQPAFDRSGRQRLVAVPENDR